MKEICITSLLVLLVLPTLIAQKNKIYQTKEISSPIKIDGNIDEAIWNIVPWEGNFIQNESVEEKKPTFDTQFKILFDQRNLYVAIRAFDSQPDSIVKLVTARDFFDGDYVEINIDSDFDRKDAFSFTITAAGIRGDEHIKTSENWFNDWNPNWTAKTKIDKEAWAAELEIPLSELKIYSPKEHWGIQINRNLERFDEGSSWTSIPDEDRWVEYFGLLKGIKNVPTSKTLSISDKVKPEFLKQDFTKLYNSLQTSYPSLYRYRSEAYIHQRYLSVLKALEMEMSLIEFHKTVLSFISEIGDGHMKVELPDYFAEAYHHTFKKLPFKLQVVANEAFITENYSDNNLLDGARITSINGKSIHSAIHEMTRLIPSDGYNLTGKYHRLSGDFDFYHSLITGFKESIKLDIVPKGQNEIQSINIALLPDTDLQKIKSDKKEASNSSSFDYQKIDNVVKLTIRTFNHAEGFVDFVDDSFQKISDSNIDKLILDFRGNGGGEESNAIHLYSYLTAKPFKYYDRYEVNIDPKKRVEQESTLISYETLNFFADISSTDKMNRHILTNFENRFLDPTVLQLPKTVNNFDGKIVVLIDGGSFSATSELCAIMKKNKRAIFVGEETGGAFDGNTSGIYDPITLPHSRLKVKVPLVKFVSATGGYNFVFGRGVMPDYSMMGYSINIGKKETDGSIDFAIKYLNFEK